MTIRNSMPLASESFTRQASPETELLTTIWKAVGAP